MTMVPYRDTSRRRSRLPLDRARVVRAALDLLDEVGLEGLTMRRLAAQLGVKAASLYRHVRDKEELVVLVADEIAGEIPTVGESSNWQDRFLAMARSHRRGLLRHRDGARILANTAPIGPRRLRHIEASLCILLDAGLKEDEAARTAHHLNNFVTEFAADEERLDAAAKSQGVPRRKLLREARQHFLALPKDEYPALTRLADRLTDDDFDGLFEFGLRVWLLGLEQLIGSSRQSRRRRG